MKKPQQVKKASKPKGKVKPKMEKTTTLNKKKRVAETKSIWGREVFNTVKKIEELKRANAHLNKPNFDKVKKEIRNILGIDEMQQNEMILESGLRWLNNEVPKDRRELVYICKDSAKWWAWFVGQYHSLDERFINETILLEKYQQPRKELMASYKHLHERGTVFIWESKAAYLKKMLKAEK